MNIQIKKIGEVLSNGAMSINGKLLRTTPVLTPDVKNGSEKVLRIISRKKEIDYISLTRALSYCLDTKKLKEILGILVQDRLISEIKKGFRVYYKVLGSLADISLNLAALEAEDNIKKLEGREFEEQKKQPIETSEPNIWAYRDILVQVSLNEYLAISEVLLYVKRYVLRNEEKIRKLKEEVKFLENIQEGDTRIREHIPDHVKMFVWNRDDGKCVECGSKKNLEFDHIIPHSKGGSDTARNLQILCDRCNRKKGGNIK